MAHNRAAGALRRPGPQTAQVGRVPVPTKGVNALSALSELSPAEAHYLYNILPSEQGLRTRLGTKEWTNGITGSGRTVIPFHSNDASRASDKLFVTGSDGIYECTTSGAAAATKVFTFATTGVTAGYGVFINWTSATGAQYIQYADSANGLLEYDATGDAWAAVTLITGFSELDVRFVTVHKLRIWYILADSSNAWYLGVDAKSGAAAEFQLGTQFTQGGDCAAIYNFSRDSGSGPDDFFIAVSRGGDVLAYQGTDPSASSTWGIIGRWQAGTVPAGRKFGVEWGGDVLLLSANGLNSVLDFFKGREPVENVSGVTSKVTNLIRDRMKSEVTTDGWEMMMYPSEGYLVIQSPQRNNTMDEWLHYVLHTTVEGWGFYRGVEAQSMGMWREHFYFGKSDGSVWYLNGFRDEVSLAAPTGMPVSFSILTAYSDGGAPGMQKKGAFIRPVFTGDTLASYSAKVLYDYSLLELSSSGSPTPNAGFVWDTGLWDQALWGGIVISDQVFGSGGIGISMAVAIRGESTARNALAEISVAFQVGGYL